MPPTKMIWSCPGELERIRGSGLFSQVDAEAASSRLTITGVNRGELRAQVGSQLTSLRAVNQADLECPHRVIGEPELEERDDAALIELNADQIGQRDASQRLASGARAHAGPGGLEDRELGVADR